MRAALLGLAAMLLPCAAEAARVTVTIANVHSAKGHVLVALCTRADFLRPHCSWKASVPARAGTVVAVIEGVPPGVYAAQAFHDEDDNGKLDRTILGLPREAMGFSRDAPMRMGPPRFDAASFEVGVADKAIGFSLRYF